MRPKKTYLENRKLRRQPQHLAYWDGEHADLPQELAEIIQESRASSSFKKTPAQDTRGTLRGLSNMMDGAEIKRAAYVMDKFTEARLCTAAGALWRLENQDQEAAVPEDLFDVKTWTPERIRRTALYALKTMPRKGGRHPTKHRDIQFAARLAAYWQKDKGTRATVTIETSSKKENEDVTFVNFSVDCFHRAGRHVSAEALKDILQEGCKIANNTKPRTP